MMRHSLTTTLLAAALAAAGQTKTPVSLAAYMDRVSRGNISLAAERLNVSMADAALTAAKVYNDPTLSISYFNNEDHSLQMGQGVEAGLGRTFTFGKRRAGISLAKSQLARQEAQLADCLRSLRADAATAWLDALKEVRLLEVRRDAARNVRLLAAADSVRLALGDITETDATQSRLEAELHQNAITEAEADCRNAIAALSLWAGCETPDTLLTPEGSLRLPPRRLALADLLNRAETGRADVVAQNADREVAHRELTVDKRERRTDIDLSLAVSRNARVRNEEAPAPPYTGVTATVAFPLKFSNANKGTLRAARYRIEQAETQGRQLRLEVRHEVEAAYRRYLSATRRAARYDEGMLQEAESVVKSKIYSYRRGEATLLEAIDAQRTYDDVRTGYIETLHAAATALVSLETAAGIWDL